MALPKPRTRSLEITQLHLVMAERGLSNIALAAFPAMKGFNSRRIANVLCEQDKTLPIRLAINKALKLKIFEKPIPLRQLKTRP